MPGQRILIVEDEEAIVEVVSQALRRHGYETASAADGDDALEKVFSLRPDLVILDLMLPKMDGWEVCRRLKADRKTASVPILMLTARREERDVVEGLEIGADREGFEGRRTELRRLAALKRLRDGLSVLRRAAKLEIVPQTHETDAALTEAVLVRERFGLVEDDVCVDAQHERDARGGHRIAGREKHGLYACFDL